MLKGVFNRNHYKGDSISYQDELHKQILRMDALEAQINKLLDSEKKLKVNVYGKNEQKTSNEDDCMKDTRVNAADISFYKQKVNELSRRMNNLEKKHREIECSQSNKTNQSSSFIEQSIDEKQVKRFIEQLVSEKLACYHGKEQKLMGRIQTLEQLVLNVDTLESKYEKMNEAQAGLIRITDELVEKHNELLKKWEDVANTVNKPNPIYETLFIDKLYLEKYEQNNNFEQLGIKELSGALNIGATYGKDVIPKKVTEAVKAEMEKLKQVKEEMEKLKGYTDEEEIETEQDGTEETECHADEFSSEWESVPSEEEEGYVDIFIEDDDT
ncbi:hypothetical protein [Cytobacillus sp.]|uniref:hypothetical protein n=1 Tax=Cytobacillus sp. TaxID=2675269 RepID=UPI0028BDAB98|nr:hypothetical protein [Cytobacillus sp.]